MTDLDAILRAVLDCPGDDTPRLVYADEIEDRGDPARAAFIRASVALAGTPKYDAVCDVCGNTPDEDGVIEHGRGCHTQSADGGGIERVEENPAWVTLNNRAAALWTGGLREPTLAAVGLDPDRAYVTMARGFIDALGGVSAADWLGHADRILAAHPVRKVTLTTVPDVVVGYDHRGREFRFTLQGRSAEVTRTEVAVNGTRRPGEHPLSGVERGMTAELLNLEWPGIVFELPPPPVDWWATREAGPEPTYVEVQRAAEDAITRGFGLPASLVTAPPSPPG